MAERGRKRELARLRVWRALAIAILGCAVLALFLALGAL